MPDVDLISADSHVIEDPHLWEHGLPATLRDDAPRFPERGVGSLFQSQPGGWDPATRVEEMAVDGVVQEVLYPSLALMLFGIADPRLHHECLRAYNDWVLEYCSVSPEHTFAVAAIGCYDVDAGVAELRRCAAAGAVGVMVWQVPPADLPFTGDHYDALWEAASCFGLPVSLHSQTGASYPWPRERPTDKSLTRGARKVNTMTVEGANAVADLLTSGIFDRFPDLHFVLVENEASWIPSFLSRYDNLYCRTDHRARASSLSMKPSEYFERNFSATFFDDPPLAGVLETWGADLCMWSNDYPHANSTWPNSRAVIERDLGELPADVRRRLVATNVADLYGLPILGGPDGN